MAHIELKELAHAYKPNPFQPSDYALRPMEMQWDDGGAYALLGPSGCGKTTLLNIISGLVRPSHGRVLFDGKEFGQLAVPGTPEEEEFLGLPGLLEPEHVHELLMQRQARQGRHRRAREERESSNPDEPAALPQALHRSLKEQRQLLNSLVGLYARQSGEAHGLVHAELRRICGGPAVSHATVAQLQARIDILRQRVRA